MARLTGTELFRVTEAHAALEFNYRQKMLGAAAMLQLVDARALENSYIFSLDPTEKEAYMQQRIDAALMGPEAKKSELTQQDIGLTIEFTNKATAIFGVLRGYNLSTATPGSIYLNQFEPNPNLHPVDHGTILGTAISLKATADGANVDIAKNAYEHLAISLEYGFRQPLPVSAADEEIIELAVARLDEINSRLELNDS